MCAYANPGALTHMTQCCDRSAIREKTTAHFLEQGRNTTCAGLEQESASGFPLVICDRLTQTHEADATAYILFVDRNQCGRTKVFLLLQGL